MSKVALSGNASGTGTFTIASPNSNTDRTLSLPDASGTILTTATAGVPVNGPAFSAYTNTTQTGLPHATYTKILFDIEEYDTNNNYASSRFTPTIAGYYQINATVSANTLNPAHRLIANIYKNGNLYKIGSNSAAGVVSYPASNVASLVYLNGSTDYVEIYAYGDMSGNTWNSVGSIYFTYFNGTLIRSAT